MPARARGPGFASARRAWIGWREGRARWRKVRAEETLLATRGDDLRAAAASRAAVRACVDRLIAAGRLPEPEAGADAGDAAVQPASASTT